MNFFAVSIFCKDRSGILRDVTKYLYDIGSNIYDSSSCALNGYFSISMIFSNSDVISSIEIEEYLVNTINDKYLMVKIFNLPNFSEFKDNMLGRIFSLNLIGDDAPGIIFDLTNILAGYSVNIIKIRTKFVSDSSSPKYIINSDILIPPGVNIKNIYRDIRILEDKFNVDVVVDQL